MPSSNGIPRSEAAYFHYGLTQQGMVKEAALSSAQVAAIPAAILGTMGGVGAYYSAKRDENGVGTYDQEKEKYPNPGALRRLSNKLGDLAHEHPAVYGMLMGAITGATAYGAGKAALHGAQARGVKPPSPDAVDWGHIKQNLEPTPRPVRAQKGPVKRASRDPLMGLYAEQAAQDSERLARGHAAPTLSSFMDSLAPDELQLLGEAQESNLVKEAVFGGMLRSATRAGTERGWKWAAKDLAHFAQHDMVAAGAKAAKSRSIADEAARYVASGNDALAARGAAKAAAAKAEHESAMAALQRAQRDHATAAAVVPDVPKPPAVDIRGPEDAAPKGASVLAGKTGKVWPWAVGGAVGLGLGGKALMARRDAQAAQEPGYVDGMPKQAGLFTKDVLRAAFRRFGGKAVATGAAEAAGARAVLKVRPRVKPPVDPAKMFSPAGTQVDPAKHFSKGGVQLDQGAKGATKLDVPVTKVPAPEPTKVLPAMPDVEPATAAAAAPEGAVGAKGAWERLKANQGMQAFGANAKQSLLSPVQGARNAYTMARNWNDPTIAGMRAANPGQFYGALAGQAAPAVGYTAAGLYGAKKLLGGGEQEKRAGLDDVGTSLARAGADGVWETTAQEVPPGLVRRMISAVRQGVVRPVSDFGKGAKAGYRFEKKVAKDVAAEKLLRGLGPDRPPTNPDAALRMATLLRTLPKERLAGISPASVRGYEVGVGAAAGAKSPMVPLLLGLSHGADALTVAFSGTKEDQEIDQGAADADKAEAKKGQRAGVIGTLLGAGAGAALGYKLVPTGSLALPLAAALPGAFVGNMVGNIAHTGASFYRAGKDPDMTDRRQALLMSDSKDEYEANLAELRAAREPKATKLAAKLPAEAGDVVVKLPKKYLVPGAALLAAFGAGRYLYPKQKQPMMDPSQGGYGPGGL